MCSSYRKLPLLDYLAVLEAVDSDAFDFDLSASGGAKLLRLSLVGTTYGIAAYRLMPSPITSSTLMLRSGKAVKSVG